MSFQFWVQLTRISESLDLLDDLLAILNELVYVRGYAKRGEAVRRATVGPRRALGGRAQRRGKRGALRNDASCYVEMESRRSRLAIGTRNSV
jgi:hypothetical protein